MLFLVCLIGFDGELISKANAIERRDRGACHLRSLYWGAVCIDGIVIPSEVCLSLLWLFRAGTFLIWGPLSYKGFSAFESAILNDLGLPLKAFFYRFTCKGATFWISFHYATPPSSSWAYLLTFCHPSCGLMEFVGIFLSLSMFFMRLGGEVSKIFTTIYFPCPVL